MRKNMSVDSKMLLGINLQMFAEGGAGADGGTGAEGAANGVNVSVPGSRKGVNPLADVKYGKQAEEEAHAPDVQQETDVPEGTDLDTEFKDLIKGKYKAQYDKLTQDTVQRRLKGTKEAVDKFNALTPTLQMLAKKYGLEDATDAKALQAAIEEDNSFYEQEAYLKGVSVEELKAVRKLETKNAELTRLLNEKNANEQAERDVAEWMRQAQAATEQFPDLDLAAELENPQFVSLLKMNIPVETAYFAMHHRELVPKAMQYASKTAEQKVVNKVIANGARPVENGLQGQASTLVKSDVSQLTRADREEIIRRVQRGEKITF